MATNIISLSAPPAYHTIINSSLLRAKAAVDATATASRSQKLLLMLQQKLLLMIV